VVWSDGFAAWKRTTFNKPFGNGSQPDPRLSEIEAQFGSITFTADLNQPARAVLTSALNQITADRADLSVQDKTVSEQSSRKIFFFDVIGPSPLVIAVAVLWVLLFLTMLFTRDHPTRTGGPGSGSSPSAAAQPDRCCICGRSPSR